MRVTQKNTPNDNHNNGNSHNNRQERMKNSDDATTQHLVRAWIRSWGTSSLALVTWAATALQTASATSIVTAGYFSAWVSRMQHRLLLFFARYGNEVILDHADKNPARGASDENAVQAAQEAELTEQGRWDPEPEDAPKSLFGGRTPKGQA